MIVQNLYLRNFRNHKQLSLLFKKGINVISGPNTSGKTNIVEAIYYLSLARSFRGVDEKSLINKQSDYSEVGCDVIENGTKRHIHVLIAEKGRSIVINGKKVSKVSELSKCLNVLLFEPRDVLLFKGSPKERRSFLDINLCKENETYFTTLCNFEKILRERNEILKQPEIDENLLQATTELLIENEHYLVSMREKFVKDINDILIKITRALTGVKGEIKISYKPFVKNDEEFKANALKAYNAVIESDIKHKATSIGIHREDFLVSLNGRDIGTYGSQGENRLVALALKLSPYFLYEEREKRPVIVLDDVMSELDKSHQTQLIKFLRKLNQVFITGTKLEIDGATQINLRKQKEVF